MDFKRKPVVANDKNAKADELNDFYLKLESDNRRNARKTFI